MPENKQKMKPDIENNEKYENERKIKPNIKMAEK